MGLLYYISYFAALAAFAFVTLSLASGLLYVSELIEEHSRLAKTVGQRGIYAIILLHIILFFSDSLPFPQMAFSVVCHVVYLQNFSSSWPVISLTSLSFIASCLLVIADHFLWFFHFSRITHEARHVRTYRGSTPNVPGFTEIASFFGLCVWLAPLFLFLSLSANDNALPVSAAEPGSPSGKSSMQAAQARVSLFRSLFSFEGLPRMRPRSSRKDSTEGLLAPHSPNPSRASIPPPSPSVSARYELTSPPRSPGFRRQESDSQPSPTAANFRLGTPRRPTPIRRSTSTQHQAGSDSSRLGLRRTSSSVLLDDDSVARHL